MTRHPFTPILLIFVALTACRSESIADNPPASILTAMAVSPRNADLSTDAADSLQLSITAYATTGARITEGVTYSTSAPSVALVSKSGVVRPIGPGMTVITAMLTLGDVTRTDSMTVMVHGPEHWSIFGEFELNAPILTGGWGEDLTGASYTGFLTLERDEATGKLRGSMHLVLHLSDQPPSAVINKDVSGSFENGILRTYTLSNWNFSLHGVMTDPDVIVGEWRCCAIGDYKGSFVGRRIK